MNGASRLLRLALMNIALTPLYFSRAKKSLILSIDDMIDRLNHESCLQSTAPV